MADLENLRRVYPDYESMNREKLLQALDNELSDLMTISGNASKVYCHVTGGIASNPMADPDVICAMADDSCTKAAEEYHKDEMEAAEVASSYGDIPDGYYFRDDLDGGRLIKKDGNA